MNVQIFLEGSDITNYVIKYTTEKKICSGVGLFSFDIENGYNVSSILTYDTVVLYEEGNKKGTYHVDSINRQEEKNYTTISCQDESKRLMDYFIDQNYMLDFPTTVRYWIEKFLNDANVSYNITAEDNGGLLSENSSLGMDSLYNILTSLVQQAGWYFYMNPDNVAIIGTLDIDWDVVQTTIYETDIIDYTRKEDDNMLRNRVIIWGNANPITNAQVYIDVVEPIPYGQDRTMLVANSSITETSMAYSLASKILKETTKMIPTKTITFAGTRNLIVGNRVRVVSRDFTGLAMITTINTEVSKTGMTTTIILDERCPRIFGFYNYSGGYVYIGTELGEVWRKPLKFTHTWSNFSTGIEINSGPVTNLAIQSDIMSCISGDRVYWRMTGDSAWRSFLPGYVDDVSASGGPVRLSTISGHFTTTTIDKTTNRIYAGFTMPVDGYDKSWVFEIFPGIGGGVSTQIITPGTVTMSGLPSSVPMVSDGYEIIDMDNNGVNTLITVMAGDSNFKFNSYNGGWNSYEPHRTMITYDGIGAISTSATFSQTLLHTTSSTSGCELHINGFYAYVIQRKTIDSWQNTQIVFTRVDLRDNSKLTRTIPVTGWCSGAYITSDNKLLFVDMLSNVRAIKVHDINANITTTVRTFYTAHPDNDTWYNFDEDLVNFFNDTIVVIAILQWWDSQSELDPYLIFQGFSYDYKKKSSRISTNIGTTFMNWNCSLSNLQMSENFVAFCTKGFRTDRVHWEELPSPGYVADIGQEVISWNYKAGGNILGTDVYEYMTPENANLIAGNDDFFSLSPAIVGSMAYVSGILVTGDYPFTYDTYLSTINIGYGGSTGSRVGGGHTIDNFPVYNMQRAFFRLYNEVPDTASFLDVLSGQVINTSNPEVVPPVYSYGAILDSENGAIGYYQSEIWYFNIYGVVRYLGNVGSALYAINAPYGKDFITLTANGRLYYFRDTSESTSYVKEPRMLIMDKSKTFYDVGKSILSGLVESSTGMMYMVYTGKPALSGFPGDEGDLNVSWDGSPGSFSYVWINTPNYVPDVRDYMETSTSGYAHRLLVPSYSDGSSSLIGISTDQFPNMGAMITLVPEYEWGIHPEYLNIVTVSGDIKHIETSHYHDHPYMFFSTDSEPSDFYQKDGYNVNQAATAFTLRNTNIPEQKITVIRVDDMI